MGGTTVAGPPEAIEPLRARLGLGVDEPALTGRLVSAASANEAASACPYTNYGYPELRIASADDPFYFSANVGKEMNAHLAAFSFGYLAVFLVLQAIVVYIAFTQVKGARRVWLWLIIPVFALVYALAGTLLARAILREHAVAVIDQIEQQRQGWPEALVMTALSQLNLRDAGWSADFPADSRPFLFGTNYTRSSDTPRTFRRAASGCRLTFETAPGMIRSAYVRSWIPANAPVTAGQGGKLTAGRAFSAAWLWDGGAWRDLGPLARGQTFDPAAAKLINFGDVHPFMYRMWDSPRQDFPAPLVPLLTAANTKALQAQGEGLFIGLGETADIATEVVPEMETVSRLVLAYQFKLAGGTP
jgi:hypothetical protein